MILTIFSINIIHRQATWYSLFSVLISLIVHNQVLKFYCQIISTFTKYTNNDNNQSINFPTSKNHKSSTEDLTFLKRKWTELCFRLLKAFPIACTVWHRNTEYYKNRRLIYLLHFYGRSEFLSCSIGKEIGIDCFPKTNSYLQFDGSSVPKVVQFCYERYNFI